MIESEKFQYLKKTFWKIVRFALLGAAFWTVVVLLFTWGIRNISDRIGEELEIPGKAVETIMLAETGGKEWQHDLGMSYYKGWNGLPEDDRKAALWFGRAADQGHADSMVMLGVIYADPEDYFITKDITDAVDLWEKATEKNDGMFYERGLFFLGLVYLKGHKKISKDTEKGIDYIKRSAEEGYNDAEYYYGKLILEGAGNLKTNKHAALKWFEKAEKYNKEAAKAAQKIRAELGIQKVD